MFNLLEKLRTQSSRGQRTLLAFSLSLLFTGLVFVMWMVKEKEVNMTDTVARQVNTYTPTDTLIKNIEDIWHSAVGTIKNTQENLKQVDFSSTVEYRR